MGSANVVAFGTGIVRQKIFAVFLGPAGFGVYGVLASLFDLLKTLVLVGAPTGLLREASNALENDDVPAIRDLLRRVRGVLLAVSAVLVAAAWLLGPMLAGRFGVPRLWILIIALALPAVAWNATSEAMINAFGAIRTLATSKVLTSLIGLGVMAALVSTLGLFGSVLQLVTGALIAVVLSTVFLRRVLPSQDRNARPGSRLLLPSVFAVGLAQTAVHGAETLNQFLFRSWLLLELGEVDAGLYQGTLGLSRQYTAAFSAAVFVYAYPLLSRVAKEATRFGGELENALRFVLAMGVPVALLLLASRDFLVALVYTADFAPMVPLLAWTVSADALALVLAVFRIAVLAAATARTFLYLGIGFEIAYALVFWAGLQLWGLEGAVAAYAVATLMGVLAFAPVAARFGHGGVSSAVMARVLAGAALLVAAFFVPLSWFGRLAMLLAAAAWVVVEREELKRAFS